MKRPTVFIHYSHDSEEHKERVLHFSNRLTKDGIVVILDQYEDCPPKEGWPRWSEKKVREVDFVIVICTENYQKRIEGKEDSGIGLGVKWEGNLIYQCIYDDDSNNTRFIPVIFKKEYKKYIPVPLRGTTYYDIESKQEYDNLYRRLTYQTAITKPTLGKLRKMPPLEHDYDLKVFPEIESIKGIAGLNVYKKDTKFIIEIDAETTELLNLHRIIRHMKPQKEETSDSGKKTTTIPKTATILHADKRRLFGIIAVSILPIKIKYLLKVFPEINWAKEINFFLRKGYLRKNQRQIEIPKTNKDILLSDEKEVESFHQEWINALKQHEYHTDVAFILAFHYIKLNDFEKAVIVLSNVIMNMEPSYWNELYFLILKKLYSRNCLKYLSQESKMNFYNSMGLCLTRERKYGEAITWFIKLRRYAKSIKNNWGIGQSYINCGVAYFESKDIQKAEKCYREAVKHARKSKDDWLLSRSLFNLGMTIYNQDEITAKRMLGESLAIQESLQDYSGITTAFSGYGSIALDKKEFTDALKWYMKAEKKAKKFDLRYLHSLILHNLGYVNFSLKKFQAAINLYRKARHIAEVEGYKYTKTLTLIGEAVLRIETGDLKKAQELFFELYKFKKDTGDSLGMTIALHDVGACLVKQRKYGEGRKLVGKALRLAKKINNEEWIFRCYLDSALSYLEGQNPGKALTEIRKNANREKKSGAFLIAGQLWESYTDLLIIKNSSPHRIEEAFRNCLDCFQKAKDNYLHLVRIYNHLYSWRWENKFFQSAIDALTELEKIARLKRNKKDIFQAIDQRGVCFQELEFFKKAESEHKKSLKIARQMKDKGLLYIALNNLGELFRKTDRVEKAIETFLEAESNSILIGDKDAEISTAINRALAIKDLGQTEEAEKLLMKCRDISKRYKIWHQYIRALHSLANNAWIEKKKKLAERRYNKAVIEAANYEIDDEKINIIFNYKNFLSNEKRFSEAINIIKNNRSSYEDSLNLHIYHIYLAELYEDLDDFNLAKKNWLKAKKLSDLVSDKEEFATCCEALAYIYEKQKKFTLADNELQTAIKSTNNLESKALLMRKRFNNFLNAGNEKRAETLFKKVENIAKQNDFVGILIDLFMNCGDYYWRKSIRTQYKALQAYIASMHEAVGYNKYDYYIRIAMHIINRLRDIESKVRVQRIKKFKKKLDEWLLNEFKKSAIKPYDTDYILLPLTVSIELSADPREDFSKGTVCKAIAKEINRLFSEV